MRALMGDRGGLASRLLATRPEPALVPASPWLEASPAIAPRIELAPAHAAVLAQGRQTPRLVVWQRQAGRWRMSVHDRNQAIALPRRDASGRPLEAVVASGLAANGVESERIAVRVAAA